MVKPDGWLHTGDLGVMHEDGCLRLTGRSRDVIIRGGENIYPREVEEFLYTHPKVGEVQVVGIPNAAPRRDRSRMGPTAAGQGSYRRRDSQLVPGPDRILQGSRSTCGLSTDFPATLSGKIQKYKIREFEIEARGLQSVAQTATA